MFQLKTIPEDFIVTEVFTPEVNEGDFAIFLLEKKNYSTLKAVQIISEEFEIKPNNISYSGTKDKNAITRQYISIKFLKDKFKKNFEKNNDLILTYLGQSKNIISLGMHTSNQFEIVIRNLEDKPNDYFLKSGKYVNYFDEQRFSKSNIEIGIAIIKGDFKKVVEKIQEYSFNEKIDEYLNKKKNDYIGALRIIPKKILQIYIKSFQSFIFNEIVSEIVKDSKYKKINIDCGDEIREYYVPIEKLEDIEIPLIGFSTKIKDEKIRNILNKYNIRERDFIIRQFPDLSEEGSYRNIFTTAKDIKYSELENDELFENKKKFKISFTLEPGSYATIFIKHLFSI